MKAALVLKTGQAPVYSDFPEPEPSEEENHICGDGCLAQPSNQEPSVRYALQYIRSCSLCCGH